MKKSRVSLYTNQSTVRNYKERKEFTSKNCPNQRTPQKKTHLKKNTLEVSPSLEAAKSILTRANNLLQITRTRLAKLPTNHDDSCNQIEGSVELTLSPKVKSITIEDIMNGLGLTELLPSFLENRIYAEDFLLLSKDDIKELPIYARNRILAFQSYFKTHKDTPILPNDLLRNVLKEIYNPTLIDNLQMSHNEIKSKSTLAPLQEHIESKGEMKENVEVNVQSDTPSFSSRVEFRFGDENVKGVLNEIIDIQSELRDLHKEYNRKTHKDKHKRNEVYCRLKLD